MNVHYFQHVPFEGPGYILTWLQEQGHNISATHFFETPYAFPRLSEIDVLIVMGGPMSVYDDHLYPWLQEEKAFIEDAIRDGKKVLGICLGAQLAALCLGAYVPTALRKEIGWYPVHPTEEAGKAAPGICKLLEQQPVVFHWHGDKFDIPYGGYELAYSEANSNQGFVYNRHVLGLQFHAEMTAEGIDLMLQQGSRELMPGAYIQDAATIRAGTGHIEAGHQLMGRILEYFLKDTL